MGSTASILGGSASTRKTRASVCERGTDDSLSDSETDIDLLSEHTTQRPREVSTMPQPEQRDFLEIARERVKARRFERGTYNDFVPRPRPAHTVPMRISDIFWIEQGKRAENYRNQTRLEDEKRAADAAESIRRKLREHRTWQATTGGAYTGS